MALRSGCKTVYVGMPIRSGKEPACQFFFVSPVSSIAKEILGGRYYSPGRGCMDAGGLWAQIKQFNCVLSWRRARVSSPISG